MGRVEDEELLQGNKEGKGEKLVLAMVWMSRLSCGALASNRGGGSGGRGGFFFAVLFELCLIVSLRGISHCTLSTRPGPKDNE